MFDDARLIQHHPGEPGRLESMQPFVVRDVDAGTNVDDVPAMRDRDTQLEAFGHGLFGHRQRREDENIARNLRRPSELHPRFTKSGISEDCRATAHQRPARQRRLEIE